MRNVILGTAGHVDHGKTALIKALTGIDTDRLAEEKKRGITIELGFAHLDFADGLRIGIVDVPGHEKFIRNMLSGAGGIDLAMLVVAANEGIMPQTVEHLNILKLLGIRDGLVVITKTDLADEEWIQMVREDIVDLVKGSFLEGKHIMEVSAHEGSGLEELKTELHRLASNRKARNLNIPFRLAVDRVFSVDGFGTVVTGTLTEGCLCVGDTVEILPSGKTAKVRSLQSHNKNVDSVNAGTRTAINLSGVKKDDISKGDTLAKPCTMEVSRMIDVRLTVLPNSARSIKNDAPVHFYHGARALLAKVILLNKDELRPGESCLAQLRFHDVLAVKYGDRFVLRFFSPLETIGGGVVLDELPRKHKRNDSAVISELLIRESGSIDKKIIQAVSERGHSLADINALGKVLNIADEDLTREIRRLESCGELIQALPGQYISASVLEQTWQSCLGILKQYHTENPLHSGMRLATLRQKLFGKEEIQRCDAVLNILVSEQKLRFVADRVSLWDFRIVLTKRQRAIRDKVLSIYSGCGIESPATDDVLNLFPNQEMQPAKMVYESLLSSGELILLDKQIYVSRENFAAAVDKIMLHFRENETLTLAQCRDLLCTSRKYAMAILEYLDKKKLTAYDGTVRRLKNVDFPVNIW